MFSFLETTLFVFSTLFGVYILLGVLLISNLIIFLRLFYCSYNIIHQFEIYFKLFFYISIFFVILSRLYIKFDNDLLVVSFCETKNRTSINKILHVSFRQILSITALNFFLSIENPRNGDVEPSPVKQRPAPKGRCVQQRRLVQIQLRRRG